MAALELRNKIEELTGVRLRNDDLFLDEQTFTVADLHCRAPRDFDPEAGLRH